MQTYIINLERSTDRKEYMENLLKPYTCFENVTFVKAVDGRALTEDECNRMVQQDKTYKHYGRYLKRTEIGCALSHRKCYEQLLDSTDETAFIFEDDILFREKPCVLQSLFEKLKPTLTIKSPTIVLFFGEYWWTYSEKLYGKFQLKRVYDAISAQGYLINRQAASLLLKEKTYTVADDWAHIISLGVQVKALYPHVIDQEWSSFETTVSMDGYASLVRKNLGVSEYLRSYWHGGVKHFLKTIGHFDPHQIPDEEPEWAKRLGL